MMPIGPPSLMMGPMCGAKPSSRRLLVIVPAFNEAGAIAQVIQHLHSALPDCDVLVVDDGSTDRTAQVAAAKTVVVSLPFNLGIGGAMQTGYRYAMRHGYDVAVQVDGDGQHPADQVMRVVQRLEEDGVDMVIGSRFLQPGGYEPPASRMLAIRMLRSLLYLLTGQRITDTTSGLRAVNRRLIHAFAYYYPEDYPEPEVILLSHRAGYRITEVPVTMAQRIAGESSIPFAQGMFYVLKVSTALLLGLLRDPWPKAKVTPP
jgi:glycosyltransferase involved in cell wall biosynthesis